jgi:hypothetical protein
MLEVRVIIFFEILFYGFLCKKNIKKCYFNIIFLIKKYFYKNIVRRIYKQTLDIKPSLSGINLSLIAPFHPLMKRFFC